MPQHRTDSFHDVPLVSNLSDSGPYVNRYVRFFRGFLFVAVACWRRSSNSCTRRRNASISSAWAGSGGGGGELNRLRTRSNGRVCSALWAFWYISVTVVR